VQWQQSARPDEYKNEKANEKGKWKSLETERRLEDKDKEQTKI